MSAAVTAELERLTRLLRCEEPDVAFLRRFDVVELRALRVAVFERLYADQRATYARIGGASRLLPTGLATRLAQRRLPPRVAAGVVASVPPDQATAMAARMSMDYVADVAVHLSPSMARAVLTRLPIEVITSVAAELRARQDYTTMAEVVAALSDEQVLAVVNAIDDPETLLLVALRISDQEALRAVTRLIPEGRLRAMVVWSRGRARLWPELLGLLGKLPGEQRKRLLSALRS